MSTATESVVACPTCSVLNVSRDSRTADGVAIEVADGQLQRPLHDLSPQARDDAPPDIAHAVGFDEIADPAQHEQARSAPAGTSQIMRGSLFAKALSPNNLANGAKLTMLMEKITPPSMPSAKTPRWGRRYVSRRR